MIRFLTALAAEAAPLVERFAMEPEAGAFRWFRSPEAALIVAGVGKSAAAAAVAYLHARTGEAENAVWIDAGIAGHRERALGEVLLAHTVTERSSGRRWHPTPTGSAELPRVEVVTVDVPESRFDENAAYDMEASGFYPTALRFSSSELVQVVKIVSDNRKTPWSGLGTADVGGLVESGLEAVVGLASRLRELAFELSRAEAPLPELDDYSARFRMTVSERRKLARLLARWRALAPDAERGPSTCGDLSRGRDVLDRVEHRVRQVARDRPL